jgi:hypothetical protein
MNLSREVENYRERGELPASLSKRFIKALKAAERKELSQTLWDELARALEKTGSEKELLTLCLRFVRVRKIRREKGEVK